MFTWPKKMTVKEKKEILQAAGMDGGWRELPEDIVIYVGLREQLIEQMENKKDPPYQSYLKLYKESMTPDEFSNNCLEIYAICNQRAMQECLTVDQMVDVIKHCHPLVYLPIPDPEEETMN